MIFRKPYAFLIKYFKLINFILTVLLGYLVYKTYNIIAFFNEYIINDYSGIYYEGFSESYISPFLYLVILIILIGIIAIYFLLRHKNKPTKLYLFNFIYVVIFLIFVIFIKNVMISLESAILSAELARAYRDISIIVIMPQLPLILLIFLRAIGLNTKKFNFESDIKEIEISEKDSEEVEIVIKKDDVKLKRNIRRFIREFKYYVKENKFIFTIICILLFIGVAYLLYKALPPIIDRKYNQGDTFIINNISYTIEDSIITNLDYNGNLLGDNIYYLVMRVNIENATTSDVVLDYNNFRLIVNDRYVYPILDQGRNFIDYANDYYSNTIRSNTKNTYSMVYQLNEADVKKNYQIKISNGTVLSENLIIGSYNYVTISPIVINNVSTVSTTNMGSVLNFSGSYLGNTTLKLDNPIITNRYIYDYESCFKDNCNAYKGLVSIDYTVNNTTLIVLDYEYNIDNTIPFYTYSSNINTFMKTFVKIKYIENLKTAYANIKDVTPSLLKGKIVLETTNKINDSEELELAITIRNKEYLYKIK